MYDDAPPELVVLISVVEPDVPAPPGPREPNCPVGRFGQPALVTSVLIPIPLLNDVETL